MPSSFSAADQPVPNSFNPNDIAVDAQGNPLWQPRSALGEVATALERGVFSGVPRLAGMALQRASAPGRPFYSLGTTLRQWGADEAAKPALQPQPRSHGPLVNRIAGTIGLDGKFRGIDNGR